MQTIFQYDQLSLLYHEPLQLLHLNWAGTVTDEQYRHILREMVRLTHELPVQKWLFNMNNAEEVQIGDKGWIIEYMGKELTHTALNRIARVDSKSWAYEQDMRRLIADAHAKYDLPIKTKFFDTEHDALAWLSDATPGDIS